MKNENNKTNEISENVPAVVENDGANVVATVAEPDSSAPVVADARALSVADKTPPAEPTDVREYAQAQSDESMRGGYASVNGRNVRTDIAWCG